MRWLINLWWRLVFWWKKRSGWLDMHQRVHAIGTVIDINQPDTDGDRTFSVEVDTEYRKFITLGFRLTHTDGVTRPSLHCEIPPWSAQWLKDRFATMKAGDRVVVSGAWGYDGVHVRNWPMWAQIPLALWRHQPDMRNGWFEIHPVESLCVVG